MAGSLKDFREEISDEVAAILASDFQVVTTATKSVPHSSDPAITFPNLDAKTLKAKVLESCVLHVDIRRSTELSLQHKAPTVSKLYSAFVRAMTRCAQRHNGHVRGIIGDRVMVLFDADNCFVNAIETALSMNSVAQHVINKHFKANEFSCGIGIDYGRMFVTKTGFRRHGYEQQNYRSLVWLGRPANVASKLTDVAGKPAETKQESVVHVAQQPDPIPGLGALAALGGLKFGEPANALAAALNQKPALTSGTNDWQWRDVEVQEFIDGFEWSASTGQWGHKLPRLQSFFLTSRTVTVRPATPMILMTKSVYDGFKAAQPNSECIKKGLLKEHNVQVPRYFGKVYGGDVIWSAFKS